MYKTDIVVVLVSIMVVALIMYIKVNKYINKQIDERTSEIIKIKMKDISLKTDNDDKKEHVEKEQVEKFIVADAQDMHKYDKLRNQVLKESPTFNQDKIENPSKDDIVDYDKPKIDDDFYYGIINGEPRKLTEKLNKNAYLTSADFGWDAPFQTVSCANSSINDRFKSGPKQLLPSQISCGQPNKLTAENYYKTHYRAQVIPLEDYLVRGANYEEYSDSVHPTKINVRILSLNTKGLPPDQTKYRNLPTGSNFAFHNTPAMRMP